MSAIAVYVIAFAAALTIMLTSPEGEEGTGGKHGPSKVAQRDQGKPSSTLKGRVHYVDLKGIPGPLSKAVDIERMTYDPTTDSL